MSSDAGLVRICGVGELPAEGFAKEFSAGGLTLCVAQWNGVVSALSNECPHHGGPLGEGVIEDGKVVCPWHAFAFDLTTGKSGDYPTPVRVYPVSVAGDDVLVKL